MKLNILRHRSLIKDELQNRTLKENKDKKIYNHELYLQFSFFNSKLEYSILKKKNSKLKNTFNMKL